MPYVVTPQNQAARYQAYLAYKAIKQAIKGQ
jgi:hypothetical protein